MNALADYLKRYLPPLAPVSGMERLRACIGAFLGILATGIVSAAALGPTSSVPLLIAPMGASAVLLFAVPSSPLAQPWSILCGNILACLIGVTCAIWIPDPVIASAAAIGAAIAVMMLTKSLHPPSGAVALTAVLGGPVVHDLGYSFVIWPVGLNSLLLLVIAIAYNNLTGRRYPHLAPPAAKNIHDTADPIPSERIGFTRGDLRFALGQHDELIDVSPDDLDSILHRAQMHAYHRRFGEIRCEDIMSSDVVSVAPETSVRRAFALLRRHRIKALPVVNSEGRLIGIVTQTDFMQRAAWPSRTALRPGIVGKFGSIIGVAQKQPRVVADIMTAPVQFVRPDTLVTELVPAMADRGLHHLPVADAEGRVLGIVTQSDLIAALYARNLNDRQKPEPLSLAG
ncbi:CBS domain-containing membrane protein [Phyllobacterium sp. CL33Tsu]|uniref:HPP family protein n=1 Tax=Phyllobacterium sp. CL33Tsu TaxID=1798191 RepID=UPI0008E1B788|nr:MULTISPECIES: HPP family protein [unclassified Phyllobacterium]UGY08864.1 HPP family protein [Phyllobacterium sp. T1018]SFI94986.1 CBS domain-containing membrane protein [Phyllobacterium sp. CL33Tsu]